MKPWLVRSAMEKIRFGRWFKLDEERWLFLPGMARGAWIQIPFNKPKINKTKEDSFLQKQGKGLCIH
jgi:hypothetical protein